ncbi:unnamed protein product (macronuclear) [Paramecium tetraurelia]|uniref:Tr-type G domain-containing protein n=1 Tax=Paramecium tetraurelia TaxID=5888 RepID=A0D5J3_PARTE|nr:uncharacterized protein GSPATT00013740001 [Paramecium tetraurelia]CAK78310.1 unnamed protein product [Paramecium tetraurelia]|eukprot:XP_001445707.1 hypothetical protein (macronuclear) [Paramecium tetraurelia strain d4-2]
MLRTCLKKRIYTFSSIRDRINQERAERLKNLPTTTEEKIRNFGIIAHIDAGKTTTTERMLFYSGAITFPGEVHDGTTTMDFMPQERQRGITIRSAAISFNWANHQYNLIDTPGHIDFTAEVERSLRVLDGAIAIFDGVSGVQTQSETVWLQANKFNIPKIAFVNKMDRQGASLDYTLQSMKDRLHIKPFIMQIPVGEIDYFNSVIDLLTLQEIVWLDKYGSEVQFRDVDKSHRYYDKAIQARDDLLSTVSEYDDKIAELYLEDSKELLNQQLLLHSIRQIINTNYNQCCPIYVGSALKNRGIQPILDAVHQLLPGPSERPLIFDINNPNNKRKLEKSEKLTAYVYKVLQDQDLGLLGFTRIYSGEMTQKQNYNNSTKDELIKVNNLYRVRANRYVPINSVQAGDIIAIQSKQAVAGSTIIGPNDERFVLQQLQLPQCVFFANLEYESAKDKLKLDQALQQLQLEDESLKISIIDESLITIGGQGELHLEIVVQRLKEDFGLNTKLKKMQVEYKESISEEGVLEVKYQDILKGRPLWFKLKLKLQPSEQQENEVIFDFDRENDFDILYKQFKESQLRLVPNQKIESSIKYIKNPCKNIEVDSIFDDHGEEKAYHISSLPFPMFFQLEKSILASLNRGFLKSYQMQGVNATILDGAFSVKRTNDLAIGRAVQKLMTEIHPLLKPIILEPIMDLEISCPNSLQQRIINDLISHRRGKIIEIKQDQNRAGSQNSNRVILTATIPSQETIGYSTAIRSISQGEAYFSMSFKQYEFVGGQKQSELISEVF